MVNGLCFYYIFINYSEHFIVPWLRELYKIPSGSIAHHFIIAGKAKENFFMSRLGKSIFWKGNARIDFSGHQRI